MSSQSKIGSSLPGKSDQKAVFDLKTIFQAFPDLLFFLDHDGVITDYLAGNTQALYVTPNEFLGKRMVDVLPADVADLFIKAINQAKAVGKNASVEYKLTTGMGPRWYLAKCIRQTDLSIAVIARDITEQKKAEEITRQQFSLMTALNESARQLSKEVDLQALGKYITRSCVEQFGVKQAWLGSLREKQALKFLRQWPGESLQTEFVAPIEPTPSEIAYLLEKKTHLITQTGRLHSDYNRVKVLFPLVLHSQVIGILGLVSETADFFTNETIEFFHAYSLLVATALENARLFSDSKRQLVQIQTLRSIDQAILSSMDLNSMAEVILKEAAKHIHADAVALLALDPKTKMLNFIHGYGFKSDTLQHTHLKIGESMAGRVALERQTIFIRNLQEDPQSFSRAPSFETEGFLTYHGTPLIARGQIKGVLEIFHRRAFEPDQDWLNVLETLSNQIAIAIDNALLVEVLKNSNAELHVAYDATIVGLSHALELRDSETQGHTLRVTEITLELARRIGTFSEVDLAHIRQGALLHDIGKVGIPDAILLKPGSLTPHEWKIMRQHPVYAEEILSTIEHLKPALDIPRHHHEKWDGNGYPNQLKGEHIPIAARIFSVVDVFDALTSDRPYRSAWPREQALEYIQAQSRFHFDPEIVPVFLEMVKGGHLPDLGNANTNFKNISPHSQENYISASFSDPYFSFAFPNPSIAF